MMVQVIVDPFDKVNDNFNELYGAGAAGTNVDITGNYNCKHKR